MIYSQNSSSIIIYHQFCSAGDEDEDALDRLAALIEQEGNGHDQYTNVVNKTIIDQENKAEPASGVSTKTDNMPESVPIIKQDSENDKSEEMKGLLFSNYDD